MQGLCGNLTSEAGYFEIDAATNKVCSNKQVARESSVGDRVICSAVRFTT